MQPPEIDNRRLEEFLAHPRRAVWTVSLPMMGGMLLHVLYSVVDTAFVGRLGPSALAGLTVVFPLLFVLIALANGIGSGIGVLVSQAVGRRDTAAAERTAGTSISLGLVTGALITAAGLLFGRVLLLHLGATDRVAEQAWSYFSVLAMAAPIMMTSSFLRFILIGEGDARTPMYVMGLATTTNLVLDPIFIFGCGWGIGGAAIATACAQGASAVVLAYLLLVRRRNVVRLRGAHMWPQVETLRAVLALGIPASLAQLTMSIGALLINRVVATFGEAALAGYGAAARIDAIVRMPLFGLASGAVAVIGMFAGAARADLVRALARHVLGWGVAIAVALGLVVYPTSGLIMRIFTDHAPTIAVGRHYLGFMVFVYPMMGFGIVAGRMLLGLGYASLSLLLTAIRLIVVAVPVAYLSVYLFHTGIDGVWSGVLAGAGCATIASMLLARLMIWRRDPTTRARALPASPSVAPEQVEAG